VGASGFSVSPTLSTHCVIAWFGVFGSWLLITRDYHLTLAVATLAIALLVAPSASAVYIGGYFLRLRFARLRLWWR
jgi:hypothetical protein